MKRETWTPPKMVALSFTSQEGFRNFYFGLGNIVWVIYDDLLAKGNKGGPVVRALVSH